MRDNTGRQRVLIVDDFDIVRQGLAFCIKSYDDLLLVGEASNGLEAVELCNQVQPDVILMDVSMPGLDGIAATRMIHQQHPNISIIILSVMGSDDALIREALAAGAKDCLDKYTPVGDLIRSIRRNKDHNHDPHNHYAVQR